MDTHDLILRCENSFVGGADAIERILRRSQPIDLLLCSADVMAAGAIFECQRRGIAIPRQLGICGFDDLPIASSINPALTTVSINRVEMGRTAGQVLLKRLDGRLPMHRIVDVGFQIKERASTRKRAPRHQHRDHLGRRRRKLAEPQ